MRRRYTKDVLDQLRGFGDDRPYQLDEEGLYSVAPFDSPETNAVLSGLEGLVEDPPVPKKQTVAEQMGLPVPTRAPAQAPQQSPGDIVKAALKRKYGFGEDLGDGALQRAQEGRDERILNANLGSAMSDLGAAIGGVKPKDKTFYQDLVKNADSGVRDIETRRKGLSDDQKFGDEQEVRDPQSQRNVAYRGWLKQFVPGIASVPSFESATLADSGVLSKFADMYMRSEDRKIQRESIAATKDLARSDRKRETDERQSRWEDTKIMEHSENLAKTGIPQAVTTLRELDAAIGGMDVTKDVPGYGRMAGLVPDMLVPSGSKMERVRSLVQRLANIQLKDRSGAAVTNPEFDRFKREFGTGTFMPDSRLLEGLKNYRDALKALHGGFESGLPGNVLQRYKGRPSAVTVEQIPGQGSAPTGKVVVSNGTETLEIDPADLADAEADGYRRVQ